MSAYVEFWRKLGLHSEGRFVKTVRTVYAGTYSEDEANDLCRDEMEYLLRAHVFQVDAKTSLALEQTDSEVERPCMLPFNFMFIDGKFLLRDSFGFDGLLLYTLKNDQQKLIRMYCAIGERAVGTETEVAIIRGVVDDPMDDAVLQETGDIQAGLFDAWDDLRRFIVRIIANVLLVINEPDVKLVTVGDGEAARRRWHRDHAKDALAGLKPPLRIHRIVLTGETRRAVDAFWLDTKEGKHRFSHSFHVRGHKRRIGQDRWTWVKPYVKGRGPLVRKAYAIEPKGAQ